MEKLDKRESGMSPFDLKILIECCVATIPGLNIANEQWDSTSGHEARVFLLKCGMIDANNRATDRGHAWLDFICASPMPEKRWHFPPNNYSK